VLGFFLAVGKQSGPRPVRAFVGFYTWLFRGTPTLLQLLIVWNGLPQLFPALTGSWFTAFVAALIALSLNEAAYMAEIIRSGLLSVDPGQRLAGRALGMTSGRIMWKIVIPQSVRIVIPPFVNEFITLLKLTSLGYVISLRELMTTAQQATAVNFRYLEYYAAALVYYLAMTSVLMLAQSRLERRFTFTSARAKTRVEPALAHDAR
jgi:His/Glu/Gln/Arg/opine family amino acid ABC transporter permease subunit